jgi:oligopeptidase A
MPDHHHNPLLDDSPLPAFADIRAEHVLPAIEQALAQARATLALVLGASDPPSWATLVEPMEALGERLDRVWSPVRHLHAVLDSPTLREAYEACLPLLSAFHTELAQNEPLYAAYRSFAASPAYDALDAARRRVVDNALRDFRLGGVALAGAQRERYAAIQTRLSDLASRFSNNVLDATQAWSLIVADEAALVGVPESALAAARQRASEAGERGWRLTLDLPCYLPVMAHADDPALRQRVYEAYVTRASDLGPDAGRFDNGPLLEEILALRQEKAELLGFANYACYSLQRKMARSSDEVLDFLRDLAARSRTVAQAELDELSRFASQEHGIDTLAAWDIAYYSEKLKRRRFDISQEDLRPYFPVQRVIRGMFDIVERLFAIRIRDRADVATWHRDVSFHEITDADGTMLGALYLDPFARSGKRGGAWMDVCRTRMRRGGELQTPVAYLSCNFTPPVGERTAIITHDEVSTLFHEFGHGLHHLLTQVDIPSIAGIAGVEWDAVELPSQFLENWCYEPEALALISAHHETGAALPASLLERLRAARNFQCGMQMLRQVEFALFDFRLHIEYRPGLDVLALLEDVRDEVAVLRPPAFNRFPHAFSHIFAGGYGAGYYSYKWAEVLSSDAYSRFEESGVFDRAAGADFRREILARGGGRDALACFVAFRGREPAIAALLRHSGIEPPPEADAA